jgi:putative ABC transport system permease protein
MGALLRLIGLRQLRARPGRTALAFAGIALGVALVLAIQLINRATLAALRQTVEDSAGRAQLQVVAASDAGLPEDVLEQVRATPGVSLAVPLVEGAAFVADGQGESLAIFGVDLGDEAAVRSYRGVTSDAEQVIDDPLVFLAQPDSVVVTRAFAAGRHLGLGDRLAVVAPTGRRTLTVRGLLEPSGVARVYGKSLAIMDVMAAQRLLDRDGRLDRIDVVLREETDVERIAGVLRAALPSTLTVERPARRGEQVESMLRAFQAMLSSTTVIALMVAVFIIYNSLATVVIERRVEIGILRAIGARRRQVVALYLAEALCASALGILAGGVLGTGLAHLLVDSVSVAAATALSLPLLPHRLAPGAGVLALAAGAGLATTLLAAVLPALDAARMPIIEAIRRIAPPAAHGRGGRILAAGVALGALAAAGLAAAAYTGLLVFGYLAGLSLLAAAALLSVPAVLVAAPAIRPLAARLFGASGRLAGDLGQRMPLRTAATVAALTLGLSLSVGVSVVARSFEASVREWVHSWTKQDLFVRSADRERGTLPAPLTDDILVKLRALPGVKNLDIYRVIRQRYGGDTIALAGASSIGHENKVARVSDSFARHYHKHDGATLALDTPRGRRRFRIVAVERNYNSDRGTVSIPIRTLRRLWGDRRVTDIGLKVAPGADRATVRDEILRRFGPEYRLEVLEPSVVQADVLASVTHAFSFTWALEAITMLVAFLGVFDTVLAGVLARRREIGVLRAIGCVRRQVVAAFGLEGLLIGALGAALGVLGGIALAGTWIDFLFPDTLGYIIDVDVPVGRLLALGAGAIALAAGAAILPARRAARLAVTEALACE